MVNSRNVSRSANAYDCRQRTVKVRSSSGWTCSIAEASLDVTGIWDDSLSERMRAHDWLNGEDFDRALAMARTRFPMPPRKPLPLVESVLELLQPAPKEPLRTELPKPAAPQPPASIPRPSEAASVTRPTPAPPIPQLRVEGSLAKFLPQWRIRR